MVRWILGGVAAISLAVLVYGAPQLNNSQQSQFSGADTTSGSTNEKPPAYKNGSRDSPDGNSELFGYPEDPSAIESKQNARNRTPVYIPNRCQQNEILYPGDQESDWVCDCKPTYVYHPPTRQCYQLFTQAYCNDGQIVILEQGAKHPKCVRNQCPVNKVWFEDECVILNDYHRKCQHKEFRQVVSVQEKDNKLGCVNISDFMGKTPLDPTNETANANTNENSANVNANRGTAPSRV